MRQAFPYAPAKEPCPRHGGGLDYSCFCKVPSEAGKREWKQPDEWEKVCNALRDKLTRKEAAYAHNIDGLLHHLEYVHGCVCGRKE